MKYAIFCNTPYQLFAAVCFASGNCGPDDVCDLYVDTDNSAGNEELLSKIEAQGIFAETFRVRRRIKDMNKIKANICKVRSYLDPRWMMNKSLEGKELPPPDKYDAVMISHLGAMARWFVFSFGRAEVYMFEDGLGSYLRSQSYTMASAADRFFEKLTGRGADTIKIKKLFLFCPDFYEGENKRITEAIASPFEDKAVSEIMSELFPEDDSDTYSANRYVLLGQPGDCVDEAQRVKNDEAEQAIVDIIKETVGDDTVVRPHPRQDPAIYKALKTDTRGVSWELSCVKKLRDDSVLIGRYSTAQFTPKLLCNKETVVIFTNLLYPDESKSRMDNIQESIERLKRIYSDKQKIYCPADTDEFKSILLEDR